MEGESRLVQPAVRPPGPRAPCGVMIAAEDLLTKAPARVVFTELIRLVRTFHEGGIACPSS